MAAALGMILGMGARALGEHAQEKRQMEMAHDQMVFQMYQSHPQAAITKGGQEWLTKHGGKEVAEGFMQIGTLAHQAHQGFGQAFGGQPNSGPMSQGQGQPQPGASPQDPATEMKQRIGAMEQYMASDQWSQLSSEDQKLGTMLYNRHVQEYEKLTGQKAQSERQQAGFQQQETLRKEHVGDAEKLLHERIGAETGKEEKMIGLREGANIDEARKKKELGLTGAGDKSTKPVDPMVAANRAGVVLTKLQKQADTQFKDKEPHFWNRAEHQKWQADKEAWLAKQATTAGVNPSTGLPLSMSPVETPANGAPPPPAGFKLDK
jgi:hypothetical protein